MLTERLWVSTLVCISAIFCAAPVIAAKTTSAAEAPRALIADDWVYVGYKPTKTGIRVCPLGVTMDNSKYRDFCGKHPLITVAAYFEQLKAICPGLVPVSASPHYEHRPAASTMVFGFNNPPDGRCPGVNDTPAKN